MKKAYGKATRKIHHNPAFAGLDLISLDNNHTKEYNCNNDESTSFHLCSFRGLDYSPRGRTLVAMTPRNYIQKITKFKIFLNSLLFISLLGFCACSSKVQTNKLPNEKKFILPRDSNAKQELAINTKIKRDFEQSLKAFFKIKDKEQESIYDIGLKRGHFIEKKD